MSSREPSSPDPDALLALNRAVTTARLLSGAVHEINNALQVIAGSVELLEQQPALAPPVVKSLDRIRRQTERAAGALAELQMFTKAPLEGRERFGLRDVAAQAVALRKYAAARVGLTITLDAGEHKGTVALANAGLVQQALLNVLVNAEQAMVGKSGVIRVALREDGERVGIAVVDAGAGLSAEDRSHLFEPFVTTRSRRDGVGLGLWAARAIVQSFGGSVDVSSSSDGTTVVLWLLRADAAVMPGTGMPATRA